MSATVPLLAARLLDRLKAVADEAGEAGDELLERLQAVALSASEHAVARISGSELSESHDAILAARLQNLRAAGATATADAVGDALLAVLTDAVKAIPALALSA